MLCFSGRLFFAHKDGLFPVHRFPGFPGFWFDRIFISEALFTFPVKRFMQQLISPKGSFTYIQQEIIALLLSNFTSHDRHMWAEK